MGTFGRYAKPARMFVLLASALLCMGVLAPLGARPPLGGEAASADADPYEPNDDIGHAYGPLSPGSYEALISPQGDRDFYWIDVPQGCRALCITLTGIPESCDYDLWLYDSAGEIIDGSGNGNNQDERIQRANPAKGRYYIEVMSQENYSGSDTYLLGVSRSDLVTDRVWEKVGPPGMSPPLAEYSVAQVEACGQNVAYAVLDPEAPADGKVLKTTDYGESWQVFNLEHPDPDYKFDWTRQISVVDEETVWVGSVHTPGYGVARTTDGGEAWTYHGGNSYMYALEATSGLDAWIGGYYEPAGFIYSTFDGGYSWSAEFLSDWYAVLDIHQHGGDAWAVGTHGYSGRVLHRVTGGWEEVELPPGMPQELEGCWTLEDRGQCVVWAVGGDTILKSLDGGGSWSVYKAPAGAGSLNAVCALSSTTAYAAGDGGTILRTTDGGESWHFMYNVSTENLTSIYAYNPDHAWASGDNGTLLRLVPYNTRAGDNVTVDLGGGDSITFESVTVPGNTIKTPAPNPTDEEFSYHWCFRGCADISTSATFEGTAEVRMPFELLLGLAVEGVHVLKHTDGGSWKDITTEIDTANNVAIGRTDSLSEFVLIYPKSKINSIDPSWGIRENAVDVEITGYGFWESDTDKPYIALQKEDQADIEATDVVVHSLYRITCRFPLPAGALPDKWDVYIMNPDDMYDDTLHYGFRVMNPMPPPTVTSTSPGHAQRGTENVKVDIYGTGFWEAHPAYPTAWLSRKDEPDIAGTLYGFYGSTKARYEFDLPAGANSGPWDVNVMNPDGEVGTLPGGFMITGGLPAPTITNVDPGSGASGATVDVALTGTGFWGAPFVCLRHANEGQPAYNPILATDIVVQSPTSITCKFTLYENRAPGPWNVFIKNQDEQEATLVGGFTVTAAGGGGNTPPGSNVPVDLGGGKGATFDNVTGGGNTTATPKSDPSVANFQVLGGSCYDITTDATYSGKIRITLPYDEGSLPAGTREEDIKMLHYEGGSWKDVTLGVDTAANRVTGEVTSLSLFVLGFRKASAPTWYLAEGTTYGGMETWVLVQNPNDSEVTVDLTFQTNEGKKN
ncbi:MAG: pre-peptidase C-terminal domain-containing protein, partial [Actinobacteria bacterium]|nr:pre-peptidase C-terminal domain-containing protein [Actinomycetota bacterium]